MGRPLLLLVPLVSPLAGQLSVLAHLQLSLLQKLLPNLLLSLLLLLFAVGVALSLPLPAVHVVAVSCPREIGVDVLDLLHHDGGNGSVRKLHRKLL